LNTLSSNELKSTEIALVRTALYGGRAKCYSKIGEAELADLDLDKALSIEGHGDFTSQGPRGKSAPAAGASSTQLLMLIGILVVLLLAVVVKRMTKSAASTE
jgi:LPXTG-motif cell wall-anchored protein